MKKYQKMSFIKLNSQKRANSSLLIKTKKNVSKFIKRENFLQLTVEAINLHSLILEDYLFIDFTIKGLFFSNKIFFKK